ncbi:hypothetical protein Gotur_008433 [Gossypium turneri]
MGEIVSLICDSIASSSWASKRKSAKAICKLSEVLGDSLSSCHVLLTSLMKEIPGRLWEGKETLLDAISALSVSNHKAISMEDPALPGTILSLVSSACTKKVKKYREAAFSCLEQVIKSFGNPEFFCLVFPMLFDMCNLTSPNKTGRAPLASDTTKAGFFKFLLLLCLLDYICMQVLKICGTIVLGFLILISIFGANGGTFTFQIFLLEIESKGTALCGFPLKFTSGIALLLKLKAFYLFAESNDAEDVSIPVDKLMNCITSCIRVASVTDLVENKKKLMDVFSISLSPGFQWTVKMSAFSSVKELCSRLQSNLNDFQGTSLHAHTTAFIHELFSSVSPKLVDCISTIKISQVHIAASECLLEIAQLGRYISATNWRDIGLEGEVVQLIEKEKNEQARSTLKKCIDNLQNFERANAESN